MGRRCGCFIVVVCRLLVRGLLFVVRFFCFVCVLVDACRSLMFVVCGSWLFVFGLRSV